MKNNVFSEPKPFPDITFHWSLYWYQSRDIIIFISYSCILCSKSATVPNPSSISALALCKIGESLGPEPLRVCLIVRAARSCSDSLVVCTSVYNLACESIRVAWNCNAGEARTSCIIQVRSSALLYREGRPNRDGTSWRPVGSRIYMPHRYCLFNQKGNVPKL